MDPRLERERAVDQEPGRPPAPAPATARTGTSRIAPEAGDRGHGRQDQRLDRDARRRPRPARPRRPRTWSAPEAASRRAADAATSQTSGGSTRRDSPTTRDGDEGEVAVGAVDPSRCAVDRSRRRHQTRPGLPATQARRSARRARVDDGCRLDPRPAGLGDPPAQVVELVEVVGVGVDREEAAEPDRPTGALDGEVEARRRPVHLEGGARSGRPPRRPRPSRGRGRRALADLPTRRVGDDVDVRAADRRSASGAVSSARGWRRPTWTDATTRSKRASRSSS